MEFAKAVLSLQSRLFCKVSRHFSPSLGFGRFERRYERKRELFEVYICCFNKGRPSFDFLATFALLDREENDDGDQNRTDRQDDKENVEGGFVFIRFCDRAGLLRSCGISIRSLIICSIVIWTSLFFFLSCSVWIYLFWSSLNIVQNVYGRSTRKSGIVD